MREGRPILISDVRAEPEFLGAIDGLTSEICVPLYDAGHPAGFLNVETTGDVRLDADDLHLLTALGEQVGIALERASRPSRSASARGGWPTRRSTMR